MNTRRKRSAARLRLRREQRAAAKADVKAGYAADRRWQRTFPLLRGCRLDGGYVLEQAEDGRWFAVRGDERVRLP